MPHCLVRIARPTLNLYVASGSRREGLIEATAKHSLHIMGVDARVYPLS